MKTSAKNVKITPAIKSKIDKRKQQSSHSNKKNYEEISESDRLIKLLILFSTDLEFDSAACHKITKIANKGAFLIKRKYDKDDYDWICTNK